MGRKPDSDPWADEMECPRCSEDFLPDSLWDREDTCPWCQAEIEWEVDGDTDSGFYWADVKETKEVGIDDRL